MVIGICDWLMTITKSIYNYNTIRYSENHFSSPEQFLTIINIVNVFLFLNKIFCKNTFATPIDCYTPKFRTSEPK